MNRSSDWNGVASRPGRASRSALLGALVLLVAAVPDGLRNSARATPALTSLQSDPIWTVALELGPNEVASLHRHSRRDVQATVVVDGTSFRNVAVHLKGRSSFRPLEDKPSFTLRFGGDRLPHGLREVHLNNSVEDGSFAKEWLASQLFRAGGVPAPEVYHAMVKLNGRALGLYVVKEGFAVPFLKRELGCTSGTLYEPKRPQDGRSDLYSIQRPSIADRMNGRTIGTAALSDSGLQRLARAAEEPNLAERWHRLHEVLDVDRFIAFMAVEVMICHWDGYCLARNNFRIFFPTNGAAVFLPSGLDECFANPRLPWFPHTTASAAASVLEIPEGRKEFEATFRRLFAEHFSSMRLSNRVEELVRSLHPGLPERTYEGLREDAEALCAQLAERETFLRQALRQPEPVPLAVSSGGSPLVGWRPVDLPADSNAVEEPPAHGQPSLYIAAQERSAGSWRATVLLAPGHYRFEGLGRTRDVVPLPFGHSSGAGLRAAGRGGQSRRLVGSSSWERLEAEFEVTNTPQEIELVCELRAARGEAWFDRTSLRLFKVPQ